MRQSIEAVLNNLVFQLENKIKDKKTKKSDSQVRRPFGSF